MTALDALPPRIQAKIRIDDAGCWIWTAARTANGYGATRIAGIRTQRAHRAIYILLRGPISDDLVCDHLCRVHLCVNPDHIEIVTQLTNVHRGDLAKHLNDTHCALGHELVGDNLRVRSGKANRTPRRECRECARLRASGGAPRRYARRRDAGIPRTARKQAAA